VAMPAHMRTQFEAQGKQQQAMVRGRLSKNPFDGGHRVRAEIREVPSTEMADGGYAYFAWAWIAPVVVVPFLWLVWAFLTRGGFSFAVLGLRLVGRDGRPAARWLCAWRVFLL